MRILQAVPWASMAKTVPRSASAGTGQTATTSLASAPAALVSWEGTVKKVSPASQLKLVGNHGILDYYEKSLQGDIILRSIV